MGETVKKKRISSLAKSYEVSSELLIRLLKQEGEPSKTASSMIDSETFGKIKPTLLIEKQKLERQEMAKAGMKIPMKAVIRKAVEPPSKEEKPKVQLKKAPAPETVAPQAEIPEPKETLSETKDLPAEESPAAEVTLPEPEVDKEEKDPKVEESRLKVTVEKPDDALKARIQKYLEAKREKQGYSGRFGKVPDGQDRQKKKLPSGERPKDVFAVRAAQIGALTPAMGEGKPEGRKESSPSKKSYKSIRGRHKKTKEEIEKELVQMKNNVSKVMATLSRGAQKTKYKKDREEGEVTEGRQKIQVAEFITISELAGLMNVTANAVIAKCMELGMMVTINQRLDHETIALVADEFGFDASLMEEYTEEILATEVEKDPSKLKHRAPIVTIMGHVDHGKTSILDYIRKSRVAAKEAGGITQHIGAYKVETPSGPVCFLDTPGHQAFAAMRSRGAQLTDVVVLVVAADSKVMPQTQEAIKHARNANVQLVIAINKVDLPEANPEKIKAQLGEEGVQVEGFGGSISCVELSAKTGHNIDKLLEVLAVEAEVLELKADPESRGRGTVVETRLDKGKGAVATILIQDGTLRVGDTFVAGSYSGRVRSMIDDAGTIIKEAGPSTPVQVLGLEGLPQSGDSFQVMDDDREAREVAMRRREAAKDREQRKKRHITLEQLHEQIQSGEFHELRVIVKGDVDGSVEAISSSLEALSTKEVKVNIIHRGVGAVKEADVHLAAASDAIIIAFHILPSEAVRNLAETEGVSIKNYRIIYEVVDEIRAAMEGMLSPEYVEEVTAETKVLQIFKVPKVGIIAGCQVLSGVVDRDSKLRIYRDGIEITEAKVASLKRNKDDVNSVKAGLECGIAIEGVKDVREGDILAFFKLKEVAKKLSLSGA